MSVPEFIPYEFKRLSLDEMVRHGEAFVELLNSRRSIRDFSADPVPRRLIELAIRTASTAPSGAHRQPWKFVAISDLATKREIRIAAEAEEQDFYEGSSTPEAWREAVAPFGTDWHKPFLETAPWLVAVFEEVHSFDGEGRPRKNYYVKESVGIACGLFVTALHEMGLAALTHTPSPMAFLSKILERPKNERPYILFPIGFPADIAMVPDIRRKPLDDFTVWIDSSS